MATRAAIWCGWWISPTHTNNDLLAVNQYTVVENNRNKRPDVILFVNGLPLVLVELKNAADEKATIKSAYKQVQTYKETIPSLFTYNGFVVISDGLEARAGTVSSDLSRFMSWKTADGKVEASHLVGQLETLITGMLDPTTLLGPAAPLHRVRAQPQGRPGHGRHHHQHREEVGSLPPVLRGEPRSGEYATRDRSGQGNARRRRRYRWQPKSPESYGVPGVSQQPSGDRKGGVVWHTQGSGKSLSMVFYTGKIVLALDNPTVVVITDRNDLDDQLFDTFASSTQLVAAGTAAGGKSRTPEGVVARGQWWGGLQHHPEIPARRRQRVRAAIGPRQHRGDRRRSAPHAIRVQGPQRGCEGRSG
jgi:type I restriction enzyme R subunit